MAGAARGAGVSAALAPVAPKLALLIPRLATDHDGEVVATARAIGRVLAAAGLDFHDLAAGLAPAAPPQPEPGPRSVDEDELACAVWLRDHAILSPKEANFVDNAILILRRGRRLSQAQAAWLAGLYAREGGA